MPKASSKKIMSTDTSAARVEDIPDDDSRDYGYTDTDTQAATDSNKTTTKSAKNSTNTKTSTTTTAMSASEALRKQHAMLKQMQILQAQMQGQALGQENSHGMLMPQQAMSLRMLDKRIRKQLEEMDLVQVTGIVRAVMRLPRNEIVVLVNPEVFKCRYSNAYFVCGAASIQRLNNQSKIAAAKNIMDRHQASLGSTDFSMANEQEQQMQQQMQQHQKQQKNDSKDAQQQQRKVDDDLVNQSADTIDDGLKEWDSPLSDTVPLSRKNTPNVRLRERDIQIVMEQSSATREQAIAKLREKNGHVISAILDLTE